MRHYLFEGEKKSMYAEIIGAAKSAKTLLDLVKAARGLSNYHEIVTATTEVSTKLAAAIAENLSSLDKQSTLQQQVRELEEELLECKHFENKIAESKLYEFPTKALAFIVTPPNESGEPIHYLCTTCVNNRKQTILQPKGRFLYCSICDKTIATYLDTSRDEFTDTY